MRIIKYIFCMLACCLFLTACKQDDIPDYDLNIISPSFEVIKRHVMESEADKYVISHAANYTEYINEETIKDILSVSVFDDNITEDTAQNLVNICKEENIPIFFLMCDIAPEILESYDKAYCISADYIYIGELFAEKINEMWTNEIKDKDSDQIFTFSVITPENLTVIQQTFYDSLLKNLELLGIPLEKLDEIFLTAGDVLSYCEENKKANESFIILDSKYLELFPENYSPSGDGVEIIGIDFNVDNYYSDYPYMKLCLIDYMEYISVRDIIISNIDAKGYPFENVDHSIVDKTVYIQPKI